MAFVLVAICLVVILWSLNRYRLRASLRLAYKVKSNKLQTHLGWGILLSSKAVISYLEEYDKKYGPNCMAWMGPIPLFQTTDPQILKEILTAKNCIKKPDFLYGALSSVSGHGLLTENDPIWSLHRKLLNKAFSYNVLVSLLPIFRLGINNAMEEMQQSLQKGEKIDMMTVFRKLTLENAGRTVLQRDLRLTTQTPSKLTERFTAVLDYSFHICSYQYLRLSFLRKIAETFIYHKEMSYKKEFTQLVYESVDMVQRNEKTDPSFLPEIKSVVEVLVEGMQQNVIERHELLGEFIQIFTAAFDTTSFAMFTTLVMLAMHPHYQDRAYEEIISVAPDDNTEMAIENLDQLVFLEMALNESMRLFPPGPQAFREVTQEDLTLSNGLVLPVGQTIIINFFCLHRDKNIWGPNANTFNPDNFLPSNISARHPYSFIPFTKGVRSCIGMKYGYLAAKMSLAHLIRKYKFSTDFKFEDLEVENHVTTKLRIDPPLYIEPRISG